MLAATNRRVGVISWMRTRQDGQRALTVGVARAALAAGCIDAAAHIRPFGTWDALEAAVVSGNVDTVRAVADAGGVCSPAAFVGAIRHGGSDVLAFLCERYGVAFVEGALASLAGVACAAPCLDWLGATRPRLTCVWPRPMRPTWAAARSTRPALAIAPPVSPDRCTPPIKMSRPFFSFVYLARDEIRLEKRIKKYEKIGDPLQRERLAGHTTRLRCLWESHEHAFCTALIFFDPRQKVGLFFLTNDWPTTKKRCKSAGMKKTKTWAAFGHHAGFLPCRGRQRGASIFFINVPIGALFLAHATGPRPAPPPRCRFRRPRYCEEGKKQADTLSP
ncbi:hypothetical protein TW95_gp0616 [Pandoravirus inopinatum]|uniref:Ankyrin repeat protein n=1 Tax=Pandoravirus inopinatum TaxID=1605721 RepID=A0A0B5J6G6_9VIRU|nr:hypothetical protein TW95_gp0616 [Pandoravirus inopinatum]AJF97350.1 hypothetical protein [Pandoravirus inopinatum]